LFTFAGKQFFISTTASILASPIEYLKGVGPLRADLLKKELNIFTFGDLLEHYPFRHIDRTKLNQVSELTPLSEYAQVAGVLLSFDIIGQKAGKRLVAQLKDKTGILELTWFQGINWVQKLLEPGKSTSFTDGSVSSMAKHRSCTRNWKSLSRISPSLKISSNRFIPLQKN